MVEYTSSGYTDGGFGSTAPQKSDQSLTPSGTRVTQAMSELMDRGYTKEQAAGIVGNWMGESGPNLNPQAVQGVDQSSYQPAGTAKDVMNGLAASKHGYGLSQTTDAGRKAYMAAALQDYAPFGGYTAALNATIDEINDPKVGYPGFARATNLAGATQYGLNKYEAPADQSRAVLGTRMGFARTALGLAPPAISSVSDFYTPGPQDFGTANPVDAYGNPSYGRAPVSPVEFGGSLPDISPAPMGSTYGDLGYRDTGVTGYPTVASDQPFGISPYGTISSDQPSAPQTADVSPYGFSGMQQSRGMTMAANILSREYEATPPGSTEFQPEAPTTNTGWGGKDFDASPAHYGSISSDQPGAPRTADVSPTGFGMGFQTSPMATAGSVRQDLAPEIGDYSSDRGFHQSKPSNDWSQEAPAPDKPSFGMNVSPTSFSSMKTTSMAPATSLAQALEPSYTPTYDGSTVPAFPTADPYGTPPAPEQKSVTTQRAPSFVNNPYMSMPTAASFAPAAYTSATKAVQQPQQPAQPSFSQWGQENNITGNWSQDTSPQASNNRISGLGAFTMDPITREMMPTGNKPDLPEGYHEVSLREANSWGMNGGGGPGSDPTGGLW